MDERSHRSANPLAAPISKVVGAPPTRQLQSLAFAKAVQSIVLNSNSGGQGRQVAVAMLAAKGVADAPADGLRVLTNAVQASLQKHEGKSIALVVGLAGALASYGFSTIFSRIVLGQFLPLSKGN